MHKQAVGDNGTFTYDYKVPLTLLTYLPWIICAAFEYLFECVCYF